MRLAEVVCLSLMTPAVGLSDPVKSVVGVGGAPIPQTASIVAAKVIYCVAAAGTDLEGHDEDATGRVFSVVQVDPKLMRIEFNADKSISEFFWSERSKSFEKRGSLKLVSADPEHFAAVYESHDETYGIVKVTTIALNRRLGTAIVTNVLPSPEDVHYHPDAHPYSDSTFFGCTPNEPK